MTVITFPKHPLPAHLSELKGYDRVAAQRGISTMAVEVIEAEERVKDRLKGILQMPELLAFGGLSNELSLHFAFATNKTVDEVRAETIAIRKALAKICVPGMAIEEKENVNE